MTTVDVMRAARLMPASDLRAALLLGVLGASLVTARLDLVLACVALGAIAGAASGARWPGRRFWTVILAGGGIAVVLNAYLVAGRTLPAAPYLFGRPASIEGALLGTLLALRVLGAAVAVHGLRARWPGERAADELAALLSPLERLRVPVTEARFVTALALRFVPMLREEAKRIGRLQTLRAGRPPEGARERWKRLQAATIPVVVGALERAERVAMALEARHARLAPLRRGTLGFWGGALAAAIVIAALAWR